MEQQLFLSLTGREKVARENRVGIGDSVSAHCKGEFARRLGQREPCRQRQLVGVECLGDGD